jgi:hypothetical protein
MPRSKFEDILSEAIEDFQIHGFSSRERLERWTSKLAASLEQISTGLENIERKLREHLAEIFEKAVRKGGILRAHPTVEKFTLDRIAPRLRNELTRRILASADLIKLNREEAIAKTLKRFSGWASSVPAGGSDLGKKREIKGEIAKPIQRLPFTDRRVLIDQGMKLNNSISTVLAIDAGAIAAEWRSNWRQLNYDYREDHKERDGKIYLVKDSWAQQKGLVKKGAAGYTDEITQPAEEPFCRCYYRYVYNLSQLPEDMLTIKGKAELKRVREAA